jgi:hypothetical protein
MCCTLVLSGLCIMHWQAQLISANAGMGFDPQPYSSSTIVLPHWHVLQSLWEEIRKRGLGPEPPEPALFQVLKNLQPVVEPAAAAFR